MGERPWINLYIFTDIREVFEAYCRLHPSIHFYNIIFIQFVKCF